MIMFRLERLSLGLIKIIKDRGCWEKPIRVEIGVIVLLTFFSNSCTCVVLIQQFLLIHTFQKHHTSSQHNAELLINRLKWPQQLFTLLTDKVTLCFAIVLYVPIELICHNSVFQLSESPYWVLSVHRNVFKT